MKEILQNALLVNKLILESDVYENYIKSLNKIEQNINYKQVVDNFRRRQVEIEINSFNNSSSSAEPDIVGLSNEYSDMFLIDDCAEFIKREKELLDLIRNVFSIMTDSLNIDLSFFD